MDWMIFIFINLYELDINMFLTMKIAHSVCKTGNSMSSHSPQEWVWLVFV